MKESNNDMIDVFLYPHYKKLVRFIPGKATPNQLTATGFLFGIAAALSLIVIPGNTRYLVCSLFLYLWSLFDSLDGIYARSKGHTTEFGAFLDHFLDAIVVLCLYSAILYAFDIQQIAFILALAFRLLMSVTTYILSSYIGVLHIPRIGPTCEQFLFIFFLIISYVFPGNVVAFEAEFSFLANITGMTGISIMGIAIFIIFLVTPFTIYEHYSIAKKTLINGQTPAEKKQNKS
ncbi:MAG: CDP-alcohol phosphatidyltransferase family protein [Proteobacteria bacterium]|nr:CDP-alcohol phosphatidyltransferase family protein [Pseudomonadota bacterium]